ncbi:hypothetical protein E0Z10_g2949 [Xylaria hypoxylon]|uniref:Ribosomal protein S21 n=1 Tax=Xylaria hypoxylon TaxID=37992 RepID=A0A4Z0Z0S8_9PEZI|nr:hypothetical protein E0Z10_g2949 [Xylaria hypoxylon]
MMAELGRVAQAALRSTSLLRTTPIRSQPCRNLALINAISGRNHMSTTSSLRSSDESGSPASISAASPSRTQQRSSSPFSWINPSSAQRNTDNIADIDIQKPISSSYDLAFGGRNSQGKDGQELVDFASDLDELDLADISNNRQSKASALSAPRAHLRMVPRTGRTVYVKRDVDVARSFKLLSIQVAQNKLRSDFQSQRFHERPGKKRKRLRGDRWQRRFKKGFKATISRVRELTAQGW